MASQAEAVIAAAQAAGVQTSDALALVDFALKFGSADDEGESAGAPSTPVEAAAEQSTGAAAEPEAVVPTPEPEQSLSFVVVGASGDLAKKKTYPALFALFAEGRMPARSRIFGYARSAGARLFVHNLLCRASGTLSHCCFSQDTPPSGMQSQPPCGYLSHMGPTCPPGVAVLPAAGAAPRQAKTDAEFREHIRPFLRSKTTRFSEEDALALVDRFLQMCLYRRGQYGSAEDVGRLAAEMSQWEREVAAGSALEAKDDTGVAVQMAANRVFYFAVPPFVFVDVASAIKQSGVAPHGWTRLIVEKPFGRDTESSNELSAGLAALFDESYL